MTAQYALLTLRPGQETKLFQRHHAILRQAVASFPHVANGSIVEVRSARREFLCYATLNADAPICARAIAWEEGDPMMSMLRSIEHAILLRKQFVEDGTTAYRIINAEGDSLPGLIVDRYGPVLVIQLTTLGMDVLRLWIVNTLGRLCKPKAIFEKSTSTSRQREGLESREGWLQGKIDEPIPVEERGLQYAIRLTGSQKTGLFLDQRDMRSLVRTMAKGRTVLDCCSYVGGFSLSALAGGAKAADAVDYDDQALQTARENISNNKQDALRFSTYCMDAFHFLRKSPLPRAYDFIILDPPAFTKGGNMADGKEAYIDLNRMALQHLPPRGLLLTCSCSYQMTPPLFQEMVMQAALQAKRAVRILQRHHQAYDHPVNLFHPESDYLKSLLLWVA